MRLRYVDACLYWRGDKCLLGRGRGVREQALNRVEELRSAFNRGSSRHRRPHQQTGGDTSQSGRGHPAHSPSSCSVSGRAGDARESKTTSNRGSRPQIDGWFTRGRRVRRAQVSSTHRPQRLSRRWSVSRADGGHGCLPDRKGRLIPGTLSDSPTAGCSSAAPEPRTVVGFGG